MQKYFPNEMIGNRYGNLVVKSIEKIGRKTILNCVCDCGNEITRETYLIAKGSVKSCGCSRVDSLKRYNASGKHSKSRFKDGRSLHPLYGTWFQMISRCENQQNSKYCFYGKKGIKVCEEWHDFWTFVRWSDSVGGRPNGYTLDRIDSTKNYEPSNCRWADWNTQSTNKISNVYIQYKGKTQTISEWSKELNIHQRTLENRYKRGWSIERMLTEKPSFNNHSSRNKVLCQYTKDGKLIAKYKSLSDLPSEFNKKCVCDCANGKRSTNHGYIWKYEDE